MTGRSCCVESMASTIPTPLLDLLRGPTLLVRTGLWLLPPAQLDDAPDEAARLGIAAVDMREALLAVLPPTADFVALNANRVLELLDCVASHPAAGGCALVYNVDLLLARLTFAQRGDVWSFVYGGFPHRRTPLLITMPVTAHSLLPAAATLDQWQQVGRAYPLPELL